MVENVGGQSMSGESICMQLDKKQINLYYIDTALMLAKLITVNI